MFRVPDGAWLYFLFNTYLKSICGFHCTHKLPNFLSECGSSEPNTHLERPIREEEVEKKQQCYIDKVILSVKKREIDFCRICVIPTQTSGGIISGKL